jgi:hypothetical protein
MNKIVQYNPLTQNSLLIEGVSLTLILILMIVYYMVRYYFYIADLKDKQMIRAQNEQLFPQHHKKQN